MTPPICETAGCGSLAEVLVAGVAYTGGFVDLLCGVCGCGMIETAPEEWGVVMRPLLVGEDGEPLPETMQSLRREVFARRAA